MRAIFILLDNFVIPEFVFLGNPEGGCPEGEDSLATAKRELREETGITASSWKLMGRATFQIPCQMKRRFGFWRPG